MNKLKIFMGRVYQKVLYPFTALMKFGEPKILNDFDELSKLCLDKSIVILSGHNMPKTAYYQALVKHLDIYKPILIDRIESDPSINTIESIVSELKDKHIDLIIAVGGGSTMDASKVIAARLTNDKTIPQMRGMLKVKKSIVPLVVIPSTAGTGSECTVAAVVSDTANNQKYAISDPKLIPSYALLDYHVLTSLPPFFISTCGMDALTHAVEAYIGKANTKKTKKDAMDAIKLIMANIVPAYKEPNKDNLANMQLASYKAGLAFTKAYVGYVHSIAHSIAAYYHFSHGYLNAIILPKVLREYGKSAYKKLAKISYELGLAASNESKEVAAIKLIEKIEAINKEIDIPEVLDCNFKEEDIPLMIKHCEKETYPFYPVPCFFSENTLKKLYNNIVKK